MYKILPAIGTGALVIDPYGQVMNDEDGAPLKGSVESVTTLVDMLNSENG